MDATTSDFAELHFLIARLKWPTPSVRWWVMQELAHLLVDKTLHSVVEEFLVAKLRDCVFETEVVEILQIFWLAKTKDPEMAIDHSIGEAISARSLLSDLFLLDFDPETSRFGNTIESFSAVTGYIQHPQDLLAAECIHFPPILRSTLQSRGTMSGAPLEEQFFYEWERSKCRSGLRYQLMTHFLEGRPGTTTGQFVSELSARARSAFLRTLTVARDHHWCAPKALENAAILSLPLDPCTAWLRSQKPTFSLPEQPWPDGLPEIGKLVEDLLKESVSSEQLLGGLSLPVFDSESKFVELEVNLFWRKEESTVEMSENPIPAILGGSGLNQDAIVHCTKSNDLSAQGLDYEAITGRVFPSRYGYAQADLNIRGLYAPLPVDPDSVVSARPSNELLQFDSGSQFLGLSGYWTANWKPCFATGAKPRLGTYLIISKTFLYDVIESKKEGEIVFCWKTKSFHREHDFDSYQSIQQGGLIPISKIATL